MQLKLLWTHTHQNRMKSSQNNNFTIKQGNKYLTKDVSISLSPDIIPLQGGFCVSFGVRGPETSCSAPWLEENSRSSSSPFLFYSSSVSSVVHVSVVLPGPLFSPASLSWCYGGFQIKTAWVGLTQLHLGWSGKAVWQYFMRTH